jgi:hypothetical protein
MKVRQLCFGVIRDHNGESQQISPLRHDRDREYQVVELGDSLMMMMGVMLG